MLVGKTYWKNVALPPILYGANVIDFTIQEINILQQIENNNSGQTMGKPKCTQVAALRGEIGMSSLKGRIM